MPLEATIMIIDNSEYMRNGDYPPTRFDSQSDAVNTVFRTKIDSNPENTVGVMTMAGKGPEVLVTHAKEIGKVLTALHKTAAGLGGTADIPTAISVAQLALKHRQNKNLRQRIVLFVGSPLPPSSDERTLVRLAKKLKKNNVAVDIVSFGEDEGREANEPILRAFVENVNSADNSHFLAVPPGTRLLSDVISSSPILAGEGAAADVAMDAGGAGGSGAGAEQFEFGVDPTVDPELALALRMSMEDQRAVEASAPAAAASSTTNLEAIPEVAAPAPSTTVTTAGAGAGAQIVGAETEDEEERMLAQALALSQQEADIEMGGERESFLSTLLNLSNIFP
ncbi:hypothetical protein SISSUDRAFT_1023779 [Sistotremastrum suecicum HHB10207 ss-3]|uniref:VWFA domain-containing protein n=1 Tax=Sistotremastrum suecicum HHB10207 ss-3 TaxID=1314776 RepID=A0A166BV16_9AGAM|nr:hypothetical protein SISSUDRAFT_1023779 [Sistotremastrum suecicum HHB10207 ss-3]